MEGVTKTRYEWTQWQRKCETDARRLKNAANAAAAAGDDALRRECQGKINELQKAYSLVSAEAGLEPQKERMSVSGFRSVKPVAEQQGPKEAQRKLRELVNANPDVLKSVLKQEQHAEKIVVPSEKELSDMYGYGAKVKEEMLVSEWYKSQFSGITGNEATDLSIYKHSCKILRHRNGTLQEDLILLDYDTGEEVAVLDTSNSEKIVVHTEVFDKKAEEHIKSGKRIIAIHNHPESAPPSPEDCVSALQHGYSLGVVCCHDGKAYTYLPSKISYSSESMIDIFNMIQDCIFDQKYDILSGETTVEEI